MSKFERLDLPVDRIYPSEDNPRKTKDDEKLNELVESLATHGQLEDLSVRKVDDKFEIIDGERRWTAANTLEWKFVSCKVYGITPFEAQNIRITVLSMRENVDERQFEDAVYKQWVEGKKVGAWKLSDEQVRMLANFRNSHKMPHITSETSEAAVIEMARQTGVEPTKLVRIIAAGEERTEEAIKEIPNGGNLTSNDFRLAKPLKDAAPDQYIAVLARRAERDEDGKTILSQREMEVLVKAILSTDDDALRQSIAIGSIDPQTGRDIATIKDGVAREAYLKDAIEIKAQMEADKEAFSEEIKEAAEGKKDKRTQRDKQKMLDLLMRDNYILDGLDKLRAKTNSIVDATHIELIDNDEKRERCYSRVRDVAKICLDALDKRVDTPQRPMLVDVIENE